MDSDKIILTKELFWVLSSDTRITILKKLAHQRMTISELSRELKVAKSTVHEHLALMTGAGLIVSVPDEHEWKYYEITRNGANLLAPENSIPISILLTTIGFLFLAGSITAFVVAWFSMKQPPISTPMHGGGHPGYLFPDILSISIGILLLIAGILVLARLFRIRSSFKVDSFQSS
jgi:DNA-binding transcriptional ArsR family regulator